MCTWYIADFDFSTSHMDPQVTSLGKSINQQQWGYDGALVGGFKHVFSIIYGCSPCFR